MSIFKSFKRAASVVSLFTMVLSGYLSLSPNSPASIKTLAATNQAPTVSITSPAKGINYPTGSSVTITANASDPDGTVTQVQFYDNSTLVGTDTVGSDGWSTTINNISAGSHIIAVRAMDDGGLNSPDAVLTFGVAAPQPPKIEFGTGGYLALVGDDVTVGVKATDPDGIVTQVVFYDEEKLYATVLHTTDGFYSTTFQNIQHGHNVRAQAVDNSGNFTDTFINVSAEPLPIPKGPIRADISYTGVDDAPLHAGSNLKLFSYARTNDVGGSIVRVEFYDGAMLIGNGSYEAGDWTTRLNNVSAGLHTLIARATDNFGLSIVDTTILNVPKDPTISITLPNGANFNLGDTVPITANASDPDGSISQVVFTDNATGEISTDTTSPYSTTINNISAGSHVIRATATNNSGVTSYTETTISVKPYQAPTISISSPASGSKYKVGTDVTINANVVGLDSTVKKVEFYDRGTLFSTDTIVADGWSAVLHNITEGKHEVLLRLEDIRGGISQASVAIVVDRQLPPQIDIITPRSGAGFWAGNTVNIIADQAGTVKSLEQVEFYDNSKLISIAKSRTIDKGVWGWFSKIDNVSAGVHTITVRAKDDTGVYSKDATIKIYVTKPCPNGTFNYTTCNPCPTGTTMTSNSCIAKCTNGALNSSLQ